MLVVTLDNPTTRNEDPKPFPFQWRKNADEIVASVGRAALAMKGSTYLQAKLTLRT
ncbi:MULTISPECIES: hypothetical protein [Halomonadaceae]|uniref:hypothetical protein n=1 Tax=Halomonadaceae TaxID=28256 RepID=UPI00132FB297|nr:MULTISPECIES: hypothetical protein [Halomonas]